MTTLVRKLGGHLQRFLRPETATVDGSVIPARHLRFGGANFADDGEFLRSGEREADRLVRDFGLTASSRVLEVGCGTGRLPIGILRRVDPIACYRGVDVSETAVRWCRRHIESRHPRFGFVRLDLRNARYNPEGATSDDRFRLPFQDAAFDIIYLYSVFSHLLQNDVEGYLAEFRRLLAPGGRVFLTAFVEENVEPVAENPEGYRRPWKGALHCVRYDRAFFGELLARHGLRMEKMDYATETDGQSGITLALL